MTFPDSTSGRTHTRCAAGSASAVAGCDSGRRRVCIVLPSHWSGTPAGGAEYQARGLVERLVELRRFEIDYLTRRSAPAFVPQGYRIHTIATGRRIAGSFFADAPRLWRLLVRLRPDVIYQRVACAYTGVTAHYARRFGVRMVWHVSSDHDLVRLPLRLTPRDGLRRVERHLIAYGARHADTVIVQSAAQADLLRRSYGRQQSVRIANFHAAPPAPAHKPRERIRVCWVANLKPIKRPELFVRLARALRHLACVEFVMAGHPFPSPVQHADFERQVRDLPNLRYLGPLSNDDANDLLCRSHILVNTSEFEGFSNTFIQAWLRGTVVISLLVNPDGVFDAERYGCCAGGSFERTRGILERLARDPCARESIAARACTFARENFSIDNLDRLIETLVPGAGGTMDASTTI